jgi:hypothetical protein
MELLSLGKCVKYKPFFSISHCNFFGHFLLVKLAEEGSLLILGWARIVMGREWLVL